MKLLWTNQLEFGSNLVNRAKRQVRNDIMLLMQQTKCPKKTIKTIISNFKLPSLSLSCLDLSHLAVNIVLFSYFLTLFTLPLLLSLSLFCRRERERVCVCVCVCVRVCMCVHHLLLAPPPNCIHPSLSITS